MADPTMRDVFLAIRKIQEEIPGMAWMLDYPAPAKLLIQRASGEIDDQKFWYEMYKTDFWKTTSDAQRQWRSLVAIDPAKARRQRQEMAMRVRQLMGEMGVTVNPRTVRREGGAIGKNPASRVADLALYNGWSDQQLTNYLLSQATWGKEGQAPKGAIAVAMNQMRQVEEQYGVTTGDRRRFRTAKRVLNGTETIEAFEERLRARALAKYGENQTLAGVLDRGGTLEDWFGDYRQMISQELEIPESEISMNDRRWRQVLMHNDQGAVRPMTMSETQKYVRSQAEWASTSNGKRTEAAMMQALAGAFGKRAR